MTQHVPVAVSSRSTDHEETRAFLQRRVGQWAMWVFLLSSSFYVINLLLWASTGDVYPVDSLPAFLAEPGTLMHAAASLIMGSVWLQTRSRPLTVPTLRILDVGALTLACVCYALMGLFIARLLATF